MNNEEEPVGGDARAEEDWDSESRREREGEPPPEQETAAAGNASEQRSIQLRRRPTITLRSPTLPQRSQRGVFGRPLLTLFKPDGEHYSRRVLAAAGAGLVIALFGILVMRAVSRMSGGDISAAAKEETIEQALAGKGADSKRKEVRLSAGGPPPTSLARVASPSLQAGQAGQSSTPYTTVVSGSGVGSSGGDSYVHVRSSIPAALPRGGSIARSQDNHSRSMTAGQSILKKDSAPSLSFASSWAKAMVVMRNDMEKEIVNGSEDEALSLPAPPVQVPSVARNTTITLTLIEPLTSGIAAPVRARVSADVKDVQGRVLIPHGSIATLPFLAIEVHGRIPQDRQSPIVITLPSGQEMTVRGLVRAADGLPGLTGKITKAKTSPGLLKRIFRLGSRSAATLAGGAGGGLINPTDIEAAAGIDPYSIQVGNTSERSVFIPAGTTMTLIVGL